MILHVTRMLMLICVQKKGGFRRILHSSDANADDQCYCEISNIISIYLKHVNMFCRSAFISWISSFSRQLTSTLNAWLISNVVLRTSVNWWHSLCKYYSTCHASDGFLIPNADRVWKRDICLEYDNCWKHLAALLFQAGVLWLSSSESELAGICPNLMVPMHELYYLRIPLLSYYYYYHHYRHYCCYYYYR